MASAPAKTTEELSTTVKSLVDKVLEADVADQIAQRGREMAAIVADATDTAAQRASEAWRESAPTRRDAARAARRYSRDAASWSKRTWHSDVRPALRQLWRRRAVALGAAGAAVPAGRELVQDAAIRLGLRRREERHWGTFFVGLMIGAAAGALIAILTAPKPGRAMREELATRARGAATNASDWVPLFQREETNGSAAEPPRADEGTDVADVAPRDRSEADEAL